MRDFPFPFFDRLPVVEQARQNASQSLSDAGGSSVVGRELRDAREALGISISEMAATLRIRAVYIEALEEGRFSDLPGRPYALGFARSLATHLGLDPDAIALRLRDEVMGTATTVELVFPESTEDKRLSRTGWIAISLVLVVVAYGAWVALGSRQKDATPPEFASVASAPKPVAQRSVAEPELGADAAAAVEDKTPETTAGVVSPPESTPAPAAGALPTPPAPVTPAPVADTPKPVVAAPKPASPPPVAPVTTSAPPAPAKPAPAPAAVAAPKPTPAPAPAATAPSTAASADTSEDEADATPEPSATAGVSAPTVAAKPAQTAAASPAPVPASTAPGRILLRAHQDSWVQIQSADGVTVMARTLKAGDSYSVPDRSGLRLTTGNAGALDVIVDGQPAPSLGQPGTVRRNVALDPTRLKAGSALE
jgi:cytoskeleton protein RodZ